MARKGLGKGLDSLIPNIYNEDFDSNSTQSLEDMLKEEEETTVEEVLDDIDSKKEESKKEDSKEEDKEEESKTEEVSQDEADVDGSGDVEDTNEDNQIPPRNEVDDGPSEDLHSAESSEESVQTSPKIQVQQEHVDEVLAIVEKNPRITLWSSRSSAVFRYLRKTEPEFSISKEASVLIEEAVAKKYPEIWALFEDL